MPHNKGTDFLDKLLPNEDNAPHTGEKTSEVSIPYYSCETNICWWKMVPLHAAIDAVTFYHDFMISWFHDFMIMWPSTITKDVISWVIIWLGINVLISHRLKKGKVLKWVNPWTHRAGVEAPANLLPCPMFSRGGRWWYTVTRCISDEPSLWPFSISCAVFFL